MLLSEAGDGLLARFGYVFFFPLPCSSKHLPSAAFRFCCFSFGRGTAGVGGVVIVFDRVLSGLDIWVVGRETLTLCVCVCVISYRIRQTTDEDGVSLCGGDIEGREGGVCGG